MLAACAVASAAIGSGACTPLRPLDPEGDAGRPALDASRTDAAGLDAGTPSDAQMPDARQPDAPGLDAFARDTSAPDTFVPDAWAADAFSTDAWVSPTPIRPTSPGDVVISEIMAAPAGGTSDEWFELYNPSPTQAFDLEGCDLEGRTSSTRIRARLVVSPHAYATLGAGGTSFPADYVWAVGGPVFTLDDNVDRVAISCTGTLIDEVEYDRAFPIVDRHSAMVEAAVLGGADPAADNDAATSWCSAPTTAAIDGRDFGTPGEMNVCPP